VDHSQHGKIRVLRSRGSRQDVKGGNGREVGGSGWMNGGGVALHVKSPVPNKVDLRFVRLQFQGAVDLDGGAVVYGGHFSAVHGGGGGEEMDVKRAREKWRFLKLHCGV